MHPFHDGKLAVSGLGLVIEAHTDQRRVAPERDRAIRVLPQLTVICAAKVKCVGEGDIGAGYFGALKCAGSSVAATLRSIVRPSTNSFPASLILYFAGPYDERPE